MAIRVEWQDLQECHIVDVILVVIAVDKAVAVLLAVVAVLLTLVAVTVIVAANLPRSWRATHRILTNEL